MKKSILIILIALLFLTTLNQKSFSQSKDETPTDSISQQQIDELKNKIASKVAELNLVEKRGVLGTVEDISDTQITLKNNQGKIRIIDVDELTKFYSSSDSFGISDIKKGQTIGALGLYNKESRRILAREINDIEELQKISLGVITNIDKDKYEITLTTEKKEKIIFDIESTTNTQIFMNGKLSKSGFSKISEFQTAVITGIKNEKDPKRITANKIIIFSDIKLADKIGLILNQNIATNSAEANSDN